VGTAQHLHSAGRAGARDPQRSSKYIGEAFVQHGTVMGVSSADEGAAARFQ
jgi:hypothetical protein